MTEPAREQLRAAYDAMAAARDRRESATWKRDVREAFLQILLREELARLLEIGAGPGHDSAFFARNGMNVFCVDISREMVRLCREKGLKARVMDAVDLRFSADSFDAAYSFNALLHLPKAELPEALHEVRRVLRPGGLFFLGLYGGFAHEGVWEEDTYAPKRFFSFHADEALLNAVGAVFDVASFDRIAVGSDDERLHFQSLILRKASD